jgi:hypothetical protein
MRKQGKGVTEQGWYSTVYLQTCTMTPNKRTPKVEKEGKRDATQFEKRREDKRRLHCALCSKGRLSAIVAAATGTAAIGFSNRVGLQLRQAPGGIADSQSLHSPSKSRIVEKGCSLLVQVGRSTQRNSSESGVP